MYSYDLQMGEIHVLLAWISVLIFLARGLAYQFDLQWSTDSRLLLMVFGVNAMLAVTGLSLWVLHFLHPMRDTWLLAKLLAMVAYAGFAHWALGRGEFRSLGYLSALLMLAYMMGVSITRSPWLGLLN
jgi:uncharacterized membrane protein SirB2